MKLSSTIAFAAGLVVGWQGCGRPMVPNPGVVRVIEERQHAVDAATHHSNLDRLAFNRCLQRIHTYDCPPPFRDAFEDYKWAWDKRITIGNANELKAAIGLGVAAFEAYHGHFTPVAGIVAEPKEKKPAYDTLPAWNLVKKEARVFNVEAPPQCGEFLTPLKLCETQNRE